MASEEFDLLPQDEVEGLFMCLSVAQYRTVREPWDDIDYQLVVDLSLEVLLNPTNQSVNYVQKLFEHFEMVHGVYDLADYKDFCKKRVDVEYLEHSKLDPMEEELSQYRRATIGNGVDGQYRVTEEERMAIYEEEKQELMQEVKFVTALIGTGKILHKEIWRYLGWPRGFALKEYRDIVGSELELGDCKQGDLDLVKMDDELKAVENRFSYDRGTNDWNAQLSDLFKDLQVVSKLVTFQTIASQDCIEYMTQRLRRYFHSLNGIQIDIEYMRLVSRILNDLNYSEMKRIRKSYVSQLINYVTRRKEMIHLRMTFGTEVFCRWSEPNTGNAEKLQDEDVFHQENLMAIYHAIRKDRKVAKFVQKHPAYGKPGAIQRVIEELVNSGVVSGRYGIKEWKHRLLVTCMRFKGDTEAAKYFYSNHDDCSKVFKYIKSQAVGGM